MQIPCPSDCVWLASAREHPPAVVVRQQQKDLALLMPLMRDFSERRSQLFLFIANFVSHYQSPDLQPLIDDDVAEAASSLAATFETAARGVIYEHRPASLPAQRLMTALKAALAEVGKGAGSVFERDCAAVLRRVEESVRGVRAADPRNRRALLDLFDRVMPRRSPPPDGGERVKLVSYGKDM